MAMSVPYTCDSLMHFRNDSGTKCSEDSCGGLCPTILPRPGNTDCDKIGSYEANDVDWLMLNMYHCRTAAKKRYLDNDFGSSSQDIWTMILVLLFMIFGQ
jgi:hypothetical protein